MFRRILAAALAAGALLSAGPSSAAITFVTSAIQEVYAGAEVRDWFEESNYASDPYPDFSSSFDEVNAYTPQNLSIHTERFATLDIDGAYAGSAGSSSTATLNMSDAANGSFGIDVEAFSESAQEHVRAVTTSFLGFRYVFDLDRASRLSLTHTGRAYLQVNSGNGFSWGATFPTPGPEADFTLTLQPGTYELFRGGFLTFSLVEGPGREDRTTNWLTTFSITEGVPEPATWAMMIMGFGMTGSVLRRRRYASI